MLFWCAPGAFLAFLAVFGRLTGSREQRLTRFTHHCQWSSMEACAHWKSGTTSNSLHSPLPMEQHGVCVHMTGASEKSLAKRKNGKKRVAQNALTSVVPLLGWSWNFYRIIYKAGRSKNFFFEKQSTLMQYNTTLLFSGLGAAHGGAAPKITQFLVVALQNHF